MMDVEKTETVIVLDRGKELEEVAAEATCCQGRPSAASSGDAAR
ncbi:MAG: hypothetical protein Q7W05_06220 [Deltaproteobacteria bacterium]|jgi:hypothetical protein|nr:hypothetical protein [Deltaproteobacteria bacterium]